MNESDLKELFIAAVRQPAPDRIDTGEVLRRGRRRRRIRAGSVVVSLAAVVALTASIVLATRPAPTPPPVTADTPPACTSSDVTSRHGAYVTSNKTHQATLGVEYTSRTRCSLPGRPRLERTGSDGTTVVVPTYTVHDPFLVVHDPSQPLIVTPGHEVVIRLTWLGDSRLDSGWDNCPADPVEIVLGDVRATVDTLCRSGEIGIAGPAAVGINPGGPIITTQPTSGA